jgi:hypothetical protein
MDKVFIEASIDALIASTTGSAHRQTLRFELEWASTTGCPRPPTTSSIRSLQGREQAPDRVRRQSDYGLVETLAERCAHRLDNSRVRWLRLKLSKPARCAARSPWAWSSSARDAG